MKNASRPNNGNQNRDVEINMQTDKVTAIQTDEPVEVHTGTIDSIDDRQFRIVTEQGHISALRAFSCLVEPRPGDRVLVSVARVDRERREVDFVIISKEEADKTRVGNVGPEGRAGKRRLYGALQEAAQRAKRPGRRRGSPGRRRPQRPKKITTSIKERRARKLDRRK